MIYEISLYFASSWLNVHESPPRMRACVHRLFGANKNCSQDVNTHRLIKSAPRLPTNVKARAPVATLTYRYHWLHWLQLTPVTSTFLYTKGYSWPLWHHFFLPGSNWPQWHHMLDPFNIIWRWLGRDEDSRPCIFTWLLTDVSRRRSLQVQMGLYAWFRKLYSWFIMLRYFYHWNVGEDMHQWVLL